MTRGRPKLTDDQKKSRNMTFRTRGGMREKLAIAAEANGRSISEEIEARLLRSFDPHSLDIEQEFEMPREEHLKQWVQQTAATNDIMRSQGITPDYECSFKLGAFKEYRKV